MSWGPTPWTGLTPARPDATPARPDITLARNPTAGATPAQAYGHPSFVTDVPVQGPTDEGMRAGSCWWAQNRLPAQPACADCDGPIPRWTRSTLCPGNRLSVGSFGIGEAVSFGGRRVRGFGVGQVPQLDPNLPAALATQVAAALQSTDPNVVSSALQALIGVTPPGQLPMEQFPIAANSLGLLLAQLAQSTQPAAVTAPQQAWVQQVLTALSAQMLSGGNVPMAGNCTTWPDPNVNLTGAISCFQSWANATMGSFGLPPLRTDGVLDANTIAAFVKAAAQYVAIPAMPQAGPIPVPTPVPVPVPVPVPTPVAPAPAPAAATTTGLSTGAMVGIGLAGVAAAGGIIYAATRGGGGKARRRRR